MLLVGTLAGLVGSLVMVTVNPQHLSSGFWVYGVPSALAGAVAIQFTPASARTVCGLLCAGIAVGVFLSVLIHPALGTGERNLWPFEVVLFLVIGIVPMWAGLTAGRWARTLVEKDERSGTARE